MTPQAGAWIRSRTLPHRGVRSVQTEPTWDGSWHVATGDLIAHASGDMAGGSHINLHARALCGHQIVLSLTNFRGQLIHDYVAADSTPTIDVCLRCLRASGTQYEVHVEPKRVTITLVQ
jgi:hypothetical protein